MKTMKMMNMMKRVKRVKEMKEMEEMELSDDIQGVFFNWYPPKKLKYGKPRLGVSTA